MSVPNNFVLLIVIIDKVYIYIYIYIIIDKLINHALVFLLRIKIYYSFFLGVKYLSFLIKVTHVSVLANTLKFVFFFFFFRQLNITIYSIGMQNAGLPPKHWPRWQGMC